MYKVEKTRGVQGERLRHPERMKEEHKNSGGGEIYARLCNHSCILGKYFLFARQTSEVNSCLKIYT